MSTLSVGTIQSNTTSPPIITNSNGTEIGTTCRAWINFDGTGSSPITPRSHFNISSITKAGTADYTISFTTAMPDANYSIVGSAAPLTGGNVAIVRVDYTVTAAALVAPSTTGFSINTANTSTGGAQASSYVNIAVFR